MKKIIVLIILFLSAASLAQSVGWTDLMETNITVGNNDYDIFTNRYGNHIIVKETSALKYYKIDVEGNTLSSSDLETSAVTSPSISGDATKLYVVYRKGTENKIRTKYSSDGGTNWSYISDLDLSGTPGSIECVFSKGKLHVAFLVGTTVYFNYYDIDNLSWLAQNIQISNTGASNPRIGINNRGSVDTVYFVFNPWSRALSWRRYIVNPPSLESIQPVFLYANVDVPNLGFAVDNECLYSFYRDNSTLDFLWYVKRIYDNEYIGPGNSNGNISVDKIFTTTTESGETCTAAWDEVNTPNGIDRMRFDGDESLIYDLIYNETGLDPVNIVNLSSAENDVHVIWKDNLGTNNGNNLRYKYYDDVPLIPQDLAVTSYTVEGVSHPKLTWSFNNAPDVYINSDGYEIWRRTRESNGTWHEWSMINSVAGDVSEYVDYELSSVWADHYEAEYKIRAKDYNSHYSDYSSVVSITFGHFSKTNAFVTNYEYVLCQNYPNPFNPSTTINYSIKSAGLVTLKVYDILGTEVATLVNERKEPGNYDVTFNAANLPSGIYVYMLISGNFLDSKKLILTK